MSMHINLSPEMEGYIKGKVSSGFYGNATEVIRDAVRRMQTEEERLASFRAAVAIGDEQIEKGQGIRYTPEVRKEILKEALARKKAGKPITNPDVFS